MKGRVWCGWLRANPARTSPTNNVKSKISLFKKIEITRLTAALEGLNSSLARLAGELCRSQWVQKKEGAKISAFLKLMKGFGCEYNVYDIKTLVVRF